MPKWIRLRTLTTEEAETIRRLAKSRREPKRLVQRAELIVLMMDDPNLPATQAGLRVGFKSLASGSHWVKRFNEAGLAGLQDKPRPGRPVTHTEKVRSQVIDLALQKPRTLGYPFELWTLTRLQDSFEERYEQYLATSTIWEWLVDEGLHWKRQQSWFHDPEKHDPEFVEKRGASSDAI